MNKLLEMKKLQEGCPVMVAQIPLQIQKEIDIWVRKVESLKIVH